MAGFFDGLWSDANSQAMTALGTGLLGARRGQEGEAIQGAMNQYNTAQQLADKRKAHAQAEQMQAMQIAQMQQQMEDAKHARAYNMDRANFETPGAPAQYSAYSGGPGDAEGQGGSTQEQSYVPPKAPQLLSQLEQAKRMAMSPVPQIAAEGRKLLPALIQQAQSQQASVDLYAPEAPQAAQAAAPTPPPYVQGQAGPPANAPQRAPADARAADDATFAAFQAKYPNGATQAQLKEFVTAQAGPMPGAAPPAVNPVANAPQVGAAPTDQRLQKFVGALTAAGVPPAEIKQRVENFIATQPDVARTIEIPGPDGRKYTQQFGKNGKPVGAPVESFVPTVHVDQGNQVSFVTPRPGLVLPKSATPGELLTNARAVEKNANETNIDPNDPVIKMYGEYRQRMPVNPRNPHSVAMQAAVAKAYPNFDATQYDQRQRAARDFGTGRQGQEAQSTNVAVNHLETLQGLATALQNGDVQIINRAYNAVAEATGQPAPTSLKAAVEMVGPEITKAVIGGVTALQDREGAKQLLSGNLSPAQMVGSISALQTLFAGRLTELERTYKRTTGRTDFRDSFLSPATTTVLERGGVVGAGDGTWSIKR